MFLETVIQKVNGFLVNRFFKQNELSRILTYMLIYILTHIVHIISYCSICAA